MRRGRLDAAAVRCLFITHMHGDHCFGVGGLIAAVCEARLGGPLQGEPLRIYGPPEVQSLVAFAIRCGSRTEAAGGAALGLRRGCRGWLAGRQRRRPCRAHTRAPPCRCPFRTGGIALTTPVVVTGFVLDPRRARPPTAVEGAGGAGLSFALQGPDQGDKLPAQLAATLQVSWC